MSLKGVELQIAIPKTFEAGKIVEQHQQNTINQQMYANEALKREVAKQQTIVNETEGLNALTENEQGPGEQQQSSSSKKDKNKKQHQKAQHPFKGNLFDFSG